MRIGTNFYRNHPSKKEQNYRDNPEFSLEAINLEMDEDYLTLNKMKELFSRSAMDLQINSEGSIYGIKLRGKNYTSKVYKLNSSCKEVELNGIKLYYYNIFDIVECILEVLSLERRIAYDNFTSLL